MNHAMNTAQQMSLNRTALSATIHCLTGCAICEIPGMVIGSAFFNVDSLQKKQRFFQRIEEPNC